MPPPEAVRQRQPEVVGWEITNLCNLRCVHCYSAAATRQGAEMGTDECRRTIDGLAALGVKTIGWTGGEPLLRSDLEELTAHAWARGIHCTITTNGVLLDAGRARGLIRAGCRTIQVSLDGSTPELNRRIRGASDEEFQAVLGGIRAAKSQGARVVLASVVGRENLADARELIALGKREEVDVIRFCGFTPAGRGRQQRIKQRLLIAEEAADLLAFIEQAQADPSILISFDVGFGPVPPDFGFHECSAGTRTFYLRANGDVYPCTALVHPQFLVGNARGTPIADLWSAPAMPAMADFARDEIAARCRDCENFPNCHGGCRGSALAFTGDVKAAVPLCLYRTALKASARRRA